MSDPVKEKSGIKIVWGWVFVTVGVTLGLIVLFTLGGPLAKESLDSLGRSSEMVEVSSVQATHAVGSMLQNFLTQLSRETSKTIMKIINFLILPVIAILIGRMIINEFKKGKGGGSTHSADAHATPAVDTHTKKDGGAH